jgi:hypothetical protein
LTELGVDLYRNGSYLRRVRLGCAVAILLALAAFAVPAVAQPAGGDPLTAVNALLAQRAAALRNGDRAGWMAAVDPSAPKVLRDQEAKRFDGLRSLPLASFDLHARTDDTGDLDPAPDRFLPETRETYRFRDYDDRDAVDTLWWTYVQRDGRWYIGADDAVSDLGLDTTRDIWDLGPVRVVARPHFLVISHPEQAQRADALADIAEEAIGVLGERWDRPWSGRIPLILPGSVSELETILQSTFDLDNFVAFVVYGSVRDDGWTPTAPRIYIQDRNLSRYQRPFQLQTLVHELVHAASVPLAGPYIPNWVHEGVADWVAGGRRLDEKPPSGSDGVLPRDDEFSTGATTSIVRAYDEARSAVSTLAAVAGRGAPSSLVASAGGPKIAPGSVEYLTDDAVRRVAGISLQELQRRWKAR